MLTARQISAARILLGWRQRDLAKAAGISEGTVKNLEAGKRDALASTLRGVEKALAKAGIVFLDAGEVSPGGGLGLRLRR